MKLVISDIFRKDIYAKVYCTLGLLINTLNLFPFVAVCPINSIGVDSYILEE